MNTLYNILRYLAKAVSVVSSPLLVPTIAMYIAMWHTHLIFAPVKSRLTVLFFVFAVTCALQLIAIFLLSRFGVVKDPGLNHRKERFFPYVLAIISYLATASFISGGVTPRWMSLYFVGAANVALINVVVNFKWKISGHAAGMGGLVALTYFLCHSNMTIHNSFTIFLVAVGASGVVGTSRLLLHRHTIWQVVAGFVNGLVVCSLFLALSIK